MPYRDHALSRYAVKVRRSLRTLSSLIARAVTQPGDRFVGEAGRRVVAAIVFVFVAGLIITFSSSNERLELAITAGWGAAAACHLLLAWVFVLRSTPEQTQVWALAQDTARSQVLSKVFGRATGFSIVASASVAGYFMASGLIEGSGMLRVLSGFSVILAWLLVQTSYGFHYAYLYYRCRAGPRSSLGSDGGFEFPGEQEPGLTDFAYFAFAVGTAFAVSDVRVTSTLVRRVVMGQSLLAFAYNAAILTLALGTVLGAEMG